MDAKLTDVLGDEVSLTLADGTVLAVVGQLDRQTGSIKLYQGGPDSPARDPQDDIEK